jgi:hypothetical protein
VVYIVPATVKYCPGVEVPIPMFPVGERMRFPEGDKEVMSELAPDAAAPRSALAEAAEFAPVPPSVIGIGVRDSVGGVFDGLVHPIAISKRLNPLHMDR